MRLKPHVTKSHAINGFSRPAAEQSEGAIPGLKPRVTKSHATNGISRPAAEQSEGAIPGLKPHVTKSTGEEEENHEPGGR